MRYETVQRTTRLVRALLKENEENINSLRMWHRDIQYGGMVRAHMWYREKFQIILDILEDELEYYRKYYFPRRRVNRKRPL